MGVGNDLSCNLVSSKVRVQLSFNSIHLEN